MEPLLGQSLSEGLCLLSSKGTSLMCPGPPEHVRGPQGRSICPSLLFSHLPACPAFHPTAGQMDLQTRNARLGGGGSAGLGAIMCPNLAVHGMCL